MSTPTPSDPCAAGKFWATRLRAVGLSLTDPGFDLRQALEPLGIEFDEGELDDRAPLERIADEAVKQELRRLFEDWITAAFSGLASTLAPGGRAAVEQALRRTHDGLLSQESERDDLGCPPVGISRFEHLIGLVLDEGLQGWTEAGGEFAEGFVSRSDELRALRAGCSTPSETPDPLPAELAAYNAPTQKPDAPRPTPPRSYEPLYETLRVGLLALWQRAPSGTPRPKQSRFLVDFDDDYNLTLNGKELLFPGTTRRLHVRNAAKLINEAKCFFELVEGKTCRCRRDIRNRVRGALNAADEGLTVEASRLTAPVTLSDRLVERLSGS